MRDPTNPQTWMDAMEQVRDRFEPALTVDTLAPKIEALYAEQGLSVQPGQAQAAAQVCLASASEPARASVEPKPSGPKDTSWAGALESALLFVMMLGSSTAWLGWPATQGTIPSPVTTTPVAEENPDPQAIAQALLFVDRLTRGPTAMPPGSSELREGSPPTVGWIF